MYICTLKVFLDNQFDILAVHFCFPEFYGGGSDGQDCQFRQHWKETRFGTARCVRMISTLEVHDVQTEIK